jgi:hypothetical protein
VLDKSGNVIAEGEVAKSRLQPKGSKTAASRQSTTKNSEDIPPDLKGRTSTPLARWKPSKENGENSELIIFSKNGDTSLRTKVEWDGNYGNPVKAGDVVYDKTGKRYSISQDGFVSGDGENGVGFRPDTAGVAWKMLKPDQ